MAKSKVKIKQSTKKTGGFFKTLALPKNFNSSVKNNCYSCNKK